MVLGASSSADATRFVESLVRQDGVEIDQVVVCAGTDQEGDLVDGLTRLLPDRYKVVCVPATAGRLEQIVAARDLIKADRVLVADAGTVLSDVRTVATLIPMLDLTGVGSVGCLLRAATDRMTGSGAGYSFTQIDLRGAPAVSMSAIDPAVWRGPSTYPVVANSMGLLVVRGGLLHSLEPAGSTAMRPESDDLLLGMHLLAQGCVNLCTTIVSAYTSATPRPFQTTISVPYRMTVDELARLAESTTIVQRIA
jgi:hypothetical protein